MTNAEEKKNEGYVEIEIIEIEIYTREGKTPPEGKHYKVVIDGKHYIFHHHHVSGREILEKAEKKPIECHVLFEKVKDHEYKRIELDEKVNLAKHGVEHFKTEPPTEFCFEVDGEKYKTKKHILTPNEILEIAGLKPVANYYLISVKHNGEKISYEGKPNETIKMECPCMNFVSVYVGPTPLS